MNESFSPAVFLDRDGTLNEEKNYLHLWRDWNWLPGVIPGLKKLRDAGFKLVIASNQSGIARGLYPESDWQALCQNINADLGSHGVEIDGFYCCPHHPDHTGWCACRKPLPGLLLKAASDLKLDLSSSWLIGDQKTDADAALAAGCKPILVKTGHFPGDAPFIPAAIPVAADFTAAVNYILGASSKRFQHASGRE